MDLFINPTIFFKFEISSFILIKKFFIVSTFLRKFLIASKSVEVFSCSSFIDCSIKSKILSLAFIKLEILYLCFKSKISFKLICKLFNLKIIFSLLGTNKSIL